MHTKLQLKAFLLHQNLIYNLYGNIPPAVISFMLPLFNYYNIGSESYFPNVPLFNYKVIFKYSYFLMLKNTTWPSISFVMLLNCRLFLTHFFLYFEVEWNFYKSKSIELFYFFKILAWSECPAMRWAKLHIPYFVYLWYLLHFCWVSRQAYIEEILWDPKCFVC